jgi:hypothetical protein
LTGFDSVTRKYCVFSLSASPTTVTRIVPVVLPAGIVSVPLAAR